MGERIAAVIAAAGQGVRMGAEKNKLLLEINGRSVFAWTLEAFESCPLVDEVYVVANEKDIFSYRDIIVTGEFKKVRAIVSGGKTRAESVRNGIGEAREADIVVVHDGARPLVTPAMIEAVIAESRETGAAIAAAPATDTIKKVENGVITETPAREMLWQAQTPQVFRRRLIYEALLGCGSEVTDDASAVEQMGTPVRVVDTGYENIKITTPQDLELAEMILNKRMHR